MLATLAEQHGAWRVYTTGIEVLGYPPTWQDLLSEVMELQAALERSEV